MSLSNNPIFLTQKRLVYRGGILVAILIAALIGLSLLSGMIAYLARPLEFTDFNSPHDAGKVFYGWTIGVEIVVLILGGFVRVSRILGEERKAGLWDSNRLTPLKPRQLIVGYWFGSPLREVYMGAVLAVIGLAIVLLGKLPVTLWLGTQFLILSTTFFFGLLAVLLGIILQKPQSGIIFVVLIFFLQFFSLAMPKFFLPDFILPIYAIINLFLGNPAEYNGGALNVGWYGPPHLFGLPVYPILLSFLLQLVIGIFLWRMVIRKTANPFQPILFRWEAVALFALLLFCQHGLMWGTWHGQFPNTANGMNRFSDASPFLPIVHGGTMLLAFFILAFVSPLPESIRLKAMRTGIKSVGAIFSQSSVALAIILGFVAAAILFLQFMFSLAASWKIYLIAAGNLLTFFLIFSLVFEFCRLRHRRRAFGFVVLWLFVLCLLPFIMAGVFGQFAISKISLLSPGPCALADPGAEDLNSLLGIVGGHLLIALAFFIGWQREWKKLLARAV